MIHVPQVPFLRRSPRVTTSNPTPPAPLELVAATYQPETPSVTLTFNQAIDVSAAVAGAVEVNDPSFNSAFYAGQSVLSSTADSVTVSLTYLDAPSGDEVTMTVGAGNGIVAVNGGEEWDGVMNVVLPFGA